jgi:peptidyl-prolyl cis-trans isomerase NIMA-interacting 1
MRRMLGLWPVGLVAACGGAPPPATPAEKAPEKAEVEAQPEASAEAGPSAEVVATCIATAHATRARFSGEPAKVSVRHILVKYSGAKNAADGIKRTREEACLRALEVRDKLREGADFEEMVKEYSDEPGAATRGGSIGAVERAELEKPFADAAFELSINQMSDIVETPFGFHLIVRFE